MTRGPGDAGGDPGRVPFKMLYPYIRDALSSFDYETAIFLSEKLFYLYKPHASAQSRLAKLLLARVYLRAGKPHGVYGLLREDDLAAGPSEAALVYAQACFSLEKFAEAERALLGKADIGQVLHAGPALGPTLGPQALFLLGRICRRSSRLTQARRCFEGCLQANSLHWGAYKALCDMGVDVKAKLWCRSDAFFAGNATPPLFRFVDDTFASVIAESAAPAAAAPPVVRATAVTPAPASSAATPGAAAISMVGQSAVGTPATPAFVTPPARSQPPAPRPKPGRAQKPTREASAPPRRSARLNFSAAGGGLATKTPRRSARIMRKKARTEATGPSIVEATPNAPSEPQSVVGTPAAGPSASPESNPAPMRAPQKRKQRAEGAPARGGSESRGPTPRPFSLDAKSPTERGAGKSAGAAVRGGGDGSGASPDAAKQRAALSQTLACLADGYRRLCRFECKEAIAKFRTLSPEQLESGWVLSRIAQCHFEMTNYSKCAEMFRRARRLEPWRTEGLEYFSTCLWHLKKEVELSYLAQEVVSADREAANTWIVVGNCMSLQKEPETALRFFRRAIQLDPHSAWAHTLTAHEFVENEDFDKALRGFRQAVGVNPRHYNAWFGVGNIYFRQEKYELAAYHFRRALQINRRNSVLNTYMGMVLHANKQYGPALQYLKRAEQLEPTNSLAKFQTANVYLTLEKFHDALAMLKKVEDFAPRETSVHFLMGKVLKKLGRKDEALMHFQTTLDLHPEDKNVIKSAIDKLYLDDLDEDSDDEY